MSNRRRLHTGLIGLTLVAGLIAGCSPGSSDLPDVPAPQAGQPLPTAVVDELLLPFAFQELPTFTLPYDSPPLELDGVIFGLQEVAGQLQFTAVATDGTVLWTVERPATCSGYTLTMVDGLALAILTDVESTASKLSGTTASAYDLHTGEQVWGPVEVPGPWHGPGTVFAEAAPASAMGEVGERLALDPATGHPLAVEGELIGEFGGVVLTHDGAAIAASGGAQWQLPITELSGDAGSGRVTAVPGTPVPLGYALLAVDDSTTGHLIRTSDGHILGGDVHSATRDPAAEVILVNQSESLSGHEESGQIWKRPVRDDLYLAASGGVLTYLRSEDSVQVINAVTGEDAVGYSPDATAYAVPFLISADGAAVFSLEDFTLAATHPGF